MSDQDQTLDGLALAETSRSELAAAILASLNEAFGPSAGIVLDDPRWGLAKKGRRGATSVQVGAFGSITVPRKADGGGFARLLEARLKDYLAIEHASGRAERLAMLYEAAQAFSADLDLDRTLDAIVLRGRSLTGADICYLSMNDFKRGATYIQTASGLRSEAFKNLRLGYGEGLGGLVAKEGKPYFSSDYRIDDRFVHTVDPQVEEEGVVSVLGVPLKLGQRVIGVLFVGKRYASTFEKEEVSFLESLADHAAVAIENARLYGRLDRVARLHDQLTELLLTEQPIEALETKIGEVLGLPVHVLYGDSPEVVEGVETLVRAGPTVLGRLVAAVAVLDDEQRMALEHAAQVVAVHLLKEREVTQARLRTHGELLDALLSGSLTGEELLRRARIYGLDLAVPHKPVVYRGDQSAALRARVPDAFIAGRLGNTVALLAPEVVVPELALAGLGPTATGPGAVARSVLEATRILEVAGLLGREGLIGREEVGVYALLLDPLGAAEMEMHARSLLAPLIAYDDKHGNLLVPTLESFLDAQGSPNVAARMLQVHVNSLYYRLTRIREVLAVSLDDPEVRLQLHLACRILRLHVGTAKPSNT